MARSRAVKEAGKKRSAPLKAGPVNFLRDNTKRPVSTSPTNFLREPKKGKVSHSGGSY